MGRYDVLDEIRRLDPVKDHQRIAYLTACYEFPWDTTRALELALFRTFGVAKGTPLLESTAEFTRRPQKRYDDTVLILAEILEHGYDSERGRAALRQMNQMHRRYTIPNDEFLYVLSTFVLEPVRWYERFGWRPLDPKEKLATFHLWRAVGHRMNIKAIPETYEELEQYNIAYERAQYRYVPSNQRLAEATRDLFLGWFLPRWLWRVGAPAVYAMMDDRLLDACGLPHPPQWVRRLVQGAIKARGRMLRYLPPRRRPRLLTRQRNRTYPDGYRIEELGT